MEPTTLLPAIAMLSLVTVESGGWARRGTQWTYGSVLLAGVLAQAGGFFVTGRWAGGPGLDRHARPVSVDS